MIHPLSFPAALHVCLNMQEVEKRERAALFEFNPYSHATDLMRSATELSYAIWKGDRPVVICGLTPQRPGVLSTWMAGTDEWPRVVQEVTRFSKLMLEAALTSGIHRIETLSAGFHTAAHRWFRLLGLEQEAVLRKYGSGGEDFFLFSRVR